MKFIFLNKEYVGALHAYGKSVDVNLTIKCIAEMFDYKDLDIIESQTCNLPNKLKLKQYDMQACCFNDVYPQLLQQGQPANPYSQMDLTKISVVCNCNNEILLYEDDNVVTGSFIEKVCRALSLTHRIEDVMQMPIWSCYTDPMCTN